MGGTFIACVQSPPTPPPSPQYEGLYRTTDCRCLVPSPYYSARLMRFRSRGPSEFFSQIRHRNALTETAWEDAEQ